MTCYEKLKQDKPHWNEDELKETYEYDCPSNFGYLDDPELGWCRCGRCDECWNREIPGTVKIEEPTPKNATKAETTSESTILDSGDRTEFETGSVRDMRSGKGRFDLVPLEVAASVINGVEGAVIGHIAMFEQTNATAELYLALAKFSKLAYEGSRPTMLLEVAKHFEAGAKKYGPDNWTLGIPTWCYIDSAVRHYLKWLRGDKDEPHDRAFVWNLMCCIWEVDYSGREHKEDSNE